MSFNSEPPEAWLNVCAPTYMMSTEPKRCPPNLNLMFSKPNVHVHQRAQSVEKSMANAPR